ncbi:MAG: elongation factor G [Cyanobacteria bacterium SZAS LIN-5]|nr:elongation factor G [Cyanobacteria bacterium SZAS LIN-5]
MPTAIRNVAFIGINRSGKTSLVESILFLTGAISRRGKIQDGTMTMDYEPESISRQISTQVSVAHTTYKNVTLNILDCPGFVDFNEETRLALLGVDAAVFVVEPDAHKLIQMDHLLRFTEKIGISRMVFINKMDKPDLDFIETLTALKNFPGTKTPRPLAPLQYPIGSGTSFSGYVDVLRKEGFKYGAQGKPEKGDIPADVQDEVIVSREKLIESLADTDDVLLEQVLEGNEASIETLENDLKNAVKSGTIVPILVGSAHTDQGVFSLLDAIIALCPDPLEREYRDQSNRNIEIQANGPVIAQVLKTYIHPQSGKLSVARIITGTVRADSQLIDVSRNGEKERVGGLYSISGKKHDSAGNAGPGSIIAIARLETARTGDTLVSERENRIMPVPELIPPLYSLAIAPKNRNDETKISAHLAKLVEEDPLLIVDRDPDTHEYCLYGQGEVHLTVARQRLERKYHIALDTSRPQIAYRETIQTSAEAHGRHKKQTGGKGQFGDVYLKIQGVERGSGNKFTESIVGGAVPRQYIPGVEKGVFEALGKGPLAGFPVVDVAVNLFDGSYHDVDSDEMSFRMAAILAMREGLSKAHPVILEPITEVKIFVPSAFTSGVLGQMNGLRGHILGYGPDVTRQGWDEISAHVPQGELWDYIIELRTLSQGLGYYVWKPSHLAPVPPNLSQELIAKHSAAEAAAHHH